MSEVALHVAIRPMIDSDEPYVIGSWCRGLYQAIGLSGPTGRALARHAVNALRARSDMRVMCDMSAPDYILGFIAGEVDCMHWIQVKGSLGIRRQGLGTRMVRDMYGDAESLTCSMESPQCRRGLRVWDAWCLDLDHGRLE